MFRYIDGNIVPKILYGTAWKEEDTRLQVVAALEEGFRGFDTANQRKHYREAEVGEGITSAIKNGLVKREKIFLQSKYTFQHGQDYRLPYDPEAPISDQVAESFTSSLKHLQTSYLDSYLLHGPTERTTLGKEDWSAWHAIVDIFKREKTRWIGISNVDLYQLKLLCREAEIQPHFVQNRCFASRNWDRDIRAFCLDKGIAYQGFSLLTANRKVTMHPKMVALAARHGRSVTQIVFRFAIDSGMVPLTGTTSREHMRKNLEVFDFQLEVSEIKIIETLATK